MLQNPTSVSVVPKSEFGSKPYQFLLLNKAMKRNQYYEDLMGKKDRSKGNVPNMQQLIHTDMERMKTNRVYERKLNQDLNGPKGLNWQCKHELQRLRNDTRDVERDLMRLHRDLAKASCLGNISRSPSLTRTQKARLSSIAEEQSSTSTLDMSKTVLGRSSPMKSLVPIKKRTFNEQSHSLSKQRIQQLIAKTSDDRSLHHQQHAHTIEQQKRIVEQKLKQFLH